MRRDVVNPWTWQEQFGFVHANSIRDGQHVVFVAGQASTDDEGRPVHEGDMVAQVHRSLDNIETVLAESGMRLSNVMRLNVFTTDVDAFFTAHESLVERLNEADCRPASTLLGVARLAFPELLVELEATAVT